jgi:hypothetical protein
MARSGKHDEQVAEYGEGESAPNPVWFKPIMLGLMILGLLWVIVFYLSNQALPIPASPGGTSSSASGSPSSGS